MRLVRGTVSAHAKSREHSMRGRGSVSDDAYALHTLCKRSANGLGGACACCKCAEHGWPTLCIRFANGLGGACACCKRAEHGCGPTLCVHFANALHTLCKRFGRRMCMLCIRIGTCTFLALAGAFRLGVSNARLTIGKSILYANCMQRNFMSNCRALCTVCKHYSYFFAVLGSLR